MKCMEEVSLPIFIDQVPQTFVDLANATVVIKKTIPLVSQMMLLLQYSPILSLIFLYKNVVQLKW